MPPRYGRCKGRSPANLKRIEYTAECLARISRKIFPVQNAYVAHKGRSVSGGWVEAANRGSQSAERLNEPRLPPNCAHGYSRLTGEGGGGRPRADFSRIVYLARIDNSMPK